MEFLQEITLELDSNTAYTTVGAKQGDSSSRVIKVHVTEKGEDWKIPIGVTASYRVRKPDGYAVWNEAIIDNSENVVYVTLTEQTLAAAGRAYADILFVSGTGDEKEVLSTVSFIIIIMASPDIATNVASSNEFSRILDITDNADIVLNEAEAWAVGTKSGVPVIADDFSYAIQGNTFSISINEATFRAYVGESAGYTRYFIFTCTGIPEGEVENHWNVQQGNITLADINLADYGITITSGTPLQSNIIRVVVTDSDLQYKNNAKYYAEQAKINKESVEKLTATAEKIYADDFDTTIDYNTHDYVWYQGYLYQFLVDHVAGAWNPNEVRQELIVEKTIVDPDENVDNDEYVQLHFKMPQGPTGDVYFMTFDIDINPASPSCGNLLMYKPEHRSPLDQVSFKPINSYNNDGELYFEILN